MDTIEKKSKLAHIEYLIYLMAERNYRNGLPYFNVNYRKRRTLFKPLIANIFIGFNFLKAILSLFITEEFYSIIIGDFVYSLDFKAQFHLAIINLLFMYISVKFMNYVTKNNPHFWRTHSTGSNINEKSFQRIKHYFKIIESVLTFGFPTVYFIPCSLFAYLCYPSISLWLTIGLTWCIIFGITNGVLNEIYYWKFWYFLSFCYYSKHLLRKMNKTLKEMIEIRKKFNKNKEVMSILGSIDNIYRKLFSFNEFWSIFCFIHWLGVAVLMGNLLYQTLFGKLNIYIKIIFIVIAIGVIFFGYMVLIIIFCSSVVLEAKNTYKLLNRLNVKKEVLISTKTRIKVILVIIEFLIISEFLFTVNVIY